MRYTHLATLFGYLVLVVSSALAQTTAPGTATTPGGSPGAAPGSRGDPADWWWIILILLAVAVAIWYFM
jgi:hypothetical protein